MAEAAAGDLVGVPDPGADRGQARVLGRIGGVAEDRALAGQGRRIAAGHPRRVVVAVPGRDHAAAGRGDDAGVVAGHDHRRWRTHRTSAPSSASTSHWLLSPVIAT
ncbi:MAG: hypothetical protein HS111_18125 [Kofleriaceae bacterium]|nr:hypothetical protein [Kofleriaceae bacterium]